MSPSETSSANRPDQNKWEMTERPFTSSAPVIGPVIVFVRNAWNSVAAKWYVRPMVEQQNQYNKLFAELIDHFNSQLVEDARETSEISHDIAEVTSLLNSMNRSLESLEERLTNLERSPDVDSER